MISAIVVDDFSYLLCLVIDVVRKDISLVVGKRKAIGKISIMNGGIYQADGAVVLGVITIYNTILIAQIEKLIVPWR